MTAGFVCDCSCPCSVPVDGEGEVCAICARGDHSDFYDDDGDDGERDCLICGGEGYMTGDTLGDPLWYDEHKVYACRCCGGSGLRKDATYQ